MTADTIRALLIRYIEESRLDEEISERILMKILNILFPGKSHERPAKRMLVTDMEKKGNQP